MKKVVMMLMIGLVSKGALQAQDISAVKEDTPSMQGLVSERIGSFMAALNITPGSDRRLSNNIEERFSKEKLKSLGGFEVRHGKERRLGTNGVSTIMEFLDTKKTRVGSARVICGTSERSARSEMLKALVVNSLPLDVIVARYGLKKNGPGDLCLVEKSYDSSKKMNVVNESVIHVVRGNIAMSISIEDSSLRAEELARMLDEELIREPK